VADHRTQVARARRFLRDHAGDEIRLATVARAAGASMFHLARLYRALTGETVGRAVTRMRIERAAAALLDSPLRPISAIALEVGFRTPSSLNKAFRAALGLSPTEFRDATEAERSRRLQALVVVPQPAPFELAPPAIARSDDMRVVYVRELGPYSGISAPLAWAQLEVRLAATRLLAGQLIGASHDDPATVPADALRYDAGVIVGPRVRPPAGTQIATWRGGSFASFPFRGEYASIEAAAGQVLASFGAHGFSLRPGPCLELYRGGTPPLTELWVPIEES
jgi:AraC family transcriptional regulator